MAITVSQVEAIIKVQTQGFDSVVTSIKSLSDNFEKTSSTMLSAINKIEKAYGNIGSAAKRASKDAAKAADDTTAALMRQNKVMFDSGEQFASFAAKAAASVKQPTEAIQMLEGAFKQVSEAMNSNIMEDKQFTLSKQGWTAALGEANRKLIEQIALEKQLAATQKQEAQAAAQQQKIEAQAIAAIAKEERIYLDMINQAKSKQMGQNFGSSINSSFGIGGPKNSAKDSMSVFASIQDQQSMVNAESFKQNFNTAIQQYTNLGQSINSAKQSMAAFLAVEMSSENASKLIAQQTAAASAAMDRQANSVLRAEQQYKNLVNAIQQNVQGELKQTEYINQATVAFEKLKVAMSKPMSSAASTTAMLGFSGSINDIKRASGATASLTQAMRDFGRVSQLAFGPLSGATSRLGALIYLMDEAGAKMASLFVAGTSLAVGWGLSIKAAANFEMGLTKTSAAAGLSKTEFVQLGDSMLNLSKQLMVPTEELNKISQSAAQAGISGVKNLTEFTKVVAELTRTTSLTADTAADSILQLINVTKYPISQLGALGDMITAVGQASVGSESHVLELATEVSKAGAQFGFTAPKAIAWAGALADTGQNAESSATAIVTAIQKMAKMAEAGGPAFDQLARFVGKSGEEFKIAFTKDGPAALQAYLNQVSKLPDFYSKMDALSSVGIINVRTTRSLEALITSVGKLNEYTKMVDDSTGALSDKYNYLSNTFLRQSEGLRTNFQDIGIEIGKSVLGPVTELVHGLNVLTSATKVWAGAFEAISVAFSTILVKMAAAKTMNLLGGIGISSGGAGGTGVAATSIREMTAAEAGIISTSAAAATSIESVAIKATLLTGAMNFARTAFMALWPVALFEGAVMLIGYLDDIINREQLIAEHASNIPDAISKTITSMAAANNYEGLYNTSMSLQDNLKTAGNQHFNIRSQMDNRGALLAKQGLNPTAINNDAQMKSYQERLDNITGITAQWTRDLKQAKDAMNDIVTTTDNGLLNIAGKGTSAAGNAVDKFVEKYKDVGAQIAALANDGLKGLSKEKISDTIFNSLSDGLNKGLKAVTSGAGGQIEVMAASYLKLKSALSEEDSNKLGSIMGVLDNTFKNTKNADVPALTANLTKFYKAVSDIEGGRIAGLNAGAGAAHKIQNQGTDAEEAIIKKYKTLQDTIAANSRVLDASGKDAFDNVINTTKTVKSLDAFQSELDKIKKAGLLPDLIKQLKLVNPTEQDIMEAMSNATDRAIDQSTAVKGLVADWKEYDRVLVGLQKNKEKNAFDKSLLGMSDYDKQIAVAKYDAQKQIEGAIDTQNQKISDAQAQINQDPFGASVPDLQKVIDRGNETVILYKNLIPGAMKDAGDAVAAELDPALLASKAVMDSVRSSFVDFGVSAVENFSTIGKAFANMLQTMESEFLKRMVFGPMADLLFGKAGGTGDGNTGIIGTALKGIETWALAGFADGGAVMGNTPIIVGEKGPEIFVPGSNGQIISNDKSFGGVGMTSSPNSSSGGKQTIHLIVEASSEFNSRIVSVSGAVASQVVMSYDKKQLPSRVNQITSDPRVK